MLQLKLDENFSPYLADIFIQAGFDAETVLGENLSGSPDEIIYQVCQEENRCLITFDLDFSNILRFPVLNTHGIIVLRPNRTVTLQVMETMSLQLISILKEHDPTASLWVLEPTQLRVRKP